MIPGAVNGSNATIKRCPPEFLGEILHNVCVLRDAHLTCIYAGIDASPALPLEKAIDQEEYWFMRPIDTEVPIGEDSEDKPTADRTPIAALEWDDETTTVELWMECERRGLSLRALDPR